MIDCQPFCRVLSRFACGAQVFVVFCELVDREKLLKGLLESALSRPSWQRQVQGKCFIKCI